MGKWDVFGVGSAAVDDLLFVERFPGPDEKLPVLDRQRHGGGQTATALVAAARHGARTAFFSWLGPDELSTHAIQELEREGVDCSLVRREPGSQVIYSVIIVDTRSGSRTILYNTGSFHEPEPETLDPAWIDASRVVFIDQHAPRCGLRAAELARARGIPVVADLEKANTPDLDRLLDCVDHLIASAGFAAQRTGERRVEDMVRALAHPRQAVCVVTCGELGCWYAAQAGPVKHLPAFPVQAVDTTGCGDVFHGAYAAAIARGESVERAIVLSSATAALKATRPGGRPGIPGLERVNAFLREAGL